MQETTSGIEGGLIVAKALASPGVIGILTAAGTFIFLWPKTAKEGFLRIAAGGISSHFFGNWVLFTIAHFLPWIPIDQMDSPAKMLAAAPAWWIFGAIFKYLKRTEGKDAKQIIDEVRK